MKKLLLLVLVLSMGGCYTGPEDNKPTEPTDSHMIFDSQNWVEKNATEQWTKGEWMQIGGVVPMGFSPYVKFSSDSIKGQWAVFVNSISSPVDIVESSYKVEENCWGENSHRLTSWLYLDDSTSLHIYIEIVKISENKMRVYHRGFDLINLPEDTEILDPKLAIRTFGNDRYADFQRIDR